MSFNGQNVPRFTFSALGPDAPFLTGFVLVIPAALLALDAGRAFRRVRRDQAQVAEAPPVVAPAE